MGILGDRITERLGELKNKVDSIYTTVTNMADTVSNLTNYIKPTSDEFFIKIAFVPDDEFFSDYFTDIYDTFYEEMGFLFEIGNALIDMISAFNSASNGEIPVFTLSLPSNYGGGTFSIIDFSFYHDHRGLIQDFIRFAAWFAFLWKTYKKIPSLIY